MSRRTHVVRTDDQSSRGPSRSLGGCEIFCSYEDCGSISQGETVWVAGITITSTGDYQRCFVAATVGRINATNPESPT